MSASVGRTPVGSGASMCSSSASTRPSGTKCMRGRKYCRGTPIRAGTRTLQPVAYGDEEHSRAPVSGGGERHHPPPESTALLLRHAAIACLCCISRLATSASVLLRVPLALQLMSFSEYFRGHSGSLMQFCLVGPCDSICRSSSAVQAQPPRGVSPPLRAFDAPPPPGAFGVALS